MSWTKKVVLGAALAAGLAPCGAAVAAGDAAAGKEIYAKKCANCHGEDGAGNAKMAEKLKVELGMLDLTKATDKSDADLVKLIAEGKKPMPAASKTLDAAAIDNVFAYAKSLRK